jgi:hypothetical protein
MASTKVATRQLNTIAVGQGGTGATTLTSHGVLIGNGTGAIAATSAGTSGQVLTSNGASADPTFQDASLPSSFVGKSITIFKPNDETVTSSTTLQNDDDFLFSIAANETWKGIMTLSLAANSSGGFKCDFTVPSGCTGTMRGWGANALSSNNVSIATGLGNTGNAGGNSLSAISFTITNSSTAGTVQLRWAQNASNASGTIMSGGSVLQATRTA